MTKFLKNLDLSAVSKHHVRDPDMKFPCKLYRMLMETERQGLAHIVSWHQDGRSFRVHDQQLFVDEVLPKYFKKSKYRSFQRQCNLYGFHKITAVKPFWDSCYYHPTFVRGDDGCCKEIARPLRAKQYGNTNEKKRGQNEFPYQSPVPSLPASQTSIPSYIYAPINIRNGDVPSFKELNQVQVDETLQQSSLTVDRMGENRLFESNISELKGKDHAALVKRNRRSSYQEMCISILGDDCPLCKNEDEENLIENIVLNVWKENTVKIASGTLLNSSKETIS